jgi:DNA-binding CsgD family transcriptional regulator
MTARPSPPTLAGPPGLVVERFEVGGQTFAILEWPARGAGRAAAAVGDDAGCTGSLQVSPAQREVLDLVLAGLSNAEIARRRGRSVHTVAHQVDAIFRRLEVGSRLELYALAARRAPAGDAP